MNNPFSNFDEIEKIQLSNTYGEMNRIYPPNFDNFDRMVLLEFKKKINKLSEQNDSLPIQAILMLLSDSELIAYDNLTTYKLEVK